MRIALVYPPPWKVAGKGESVAAFGKDGPPPEYKDGDLDADFYQTPYGLFALGAQALRAGHQVKVLNLSGYSWSKVEEIVSKLDADVWGMSCWTANRRGVKLVSELIKSKHPQSCVVVGGPHATPLAPELLAHYPAVDLVCTGESDITFLEIVQRLSKGESTRAIAGSVYRDESGKVIEAPERKNTADLDDLACPHDYFDTHIMMTSRGCPWSCTFCGAETSWGRGFRANSIEYVLSAMQKVSSRLPVKMIQIKDDTFTTNKKRVLALCKELRARSSLHGGGFFWSCDTRVDLLSDELLKEMRLAGCQRLSLGVESGSQRILDAIEKKITPDDILASTELAKKYGIKVRYYMMLGNRGETRESFGETLKFLEKARPHEYVFSCLSIYPGTKDFHAAEKAGWLKREEYFTGVFQELKTPFDADEKTLAYLNDWFAKNHGLQVGHKDSARDYEAILERLGDYHAAHMDLGAAYYHDGRLDDAQRHIERAQELGYPCPGLVYNHLACIAKARGDYDGMMELFMKAAKADPQHWVLINNVNAARAWFKDNGPAKGLPLELTVRHDFQLLERTVQPTLPGPLADDYAEWKPAPAPAIPDDVFVKTPDVEGSKKGLKRLRVIDE